MSTRINFVKRLVKNTTETDLHIKDGFGVNHTIYPGKEKSICFFTGERRLIEGKKKIEHR